jgi:hypothetical protein
VVVPTLVFVVIVVVLALVSFSYRLDKNGLLLVVASIRAYLLSLIKKKKSDGKASVRPLAVK